jgi:hypothetical protein
VTITRLPIPIEYEAKHEIQMYVCLFGSFFVVLYVFLLVKLLTCLVVYEGKESVA